jgi:tRNA G18 (ribose-2'-O)-methylase SpoU
MKYHKYSTNDLVMSKGNLDELKASPRNEVYLILDNIRSIYNVGAIFRTADAAKIKKLYLCGITAYPPRKEIEKTALKTIDFVPWEYSKSTAEIVNKLKADNIQVVALEQCKESICYLDFDYKKPLAVIIGNEVDGISQEVLELCDNAIDIPMQGIANSLNVATAAGIILFKANEN